MWIIEFRCSRLSTSAAERFQHPIALATAETIETTVSAYRRLKVHEIVHSILNNRLGMIQLSAKWLPR